MEIEAITSIKARTVNNLADKALERSFNLNGQLPIILDNYIRDTPKTSRPTKQPDTKDLVL
jgi:hypothetical protein